LSGPDLSIRRYRREDQDAVLRLHNEALGSIPGAHAGDGPWDRDLERIEDEYFAGGGEFLVGVLSGEVVAMGALRRTGERTAEVCRMRVRPALWRRGYGQAILSALEERAFEIGCRLVHLDTTVELEAAQSLYRKNGYRETRRAVVSGREFIFFEKELV